MDVRVLYLSNQRPYRVGRGILGHRLVSGLGGHRNESGRGGQRDFLSSVFRGHRSLRVISEFTFLMRFPMLQGLL